MPQKCGIAHSARVDHGPKLRLPDDGILDSDPEKTESTGTNQEAIKLTGRLRARRFPWLEQRIVLLTLSE